MSKLNYLPFAKRIVSKKGASPLYFVLFITKNCNAALRALSSRLARTTHRRIDD